MSKSAGLDYPDRVSNYILSNFEARFIEVYREVNIGTTNIGKARKIDVLVLDRPKNLGFAIECKYQDAQGTTDEKIPYAIEDHKALSLYLKGGIAYGGTGFSPGVLHMLKSCGIAAYCLPEGPQYERTAETKELDHMLALHFGWWDLLLPEKRRFRRREISPPLPLMAEPTSPGDVPKSSSEP